MASLLGGFDFLIAQRTPEIAVTCLWVEVPDLTNENSSRRALLLLATPEGTSLLTSLVMWWEPKGFGCGQRR